MLTTHASCYRNNLYANTQAWSRESVHKALIMSTSFNIQQLSNHLNIQSHSGYMKTYDLDKYLYGTRLDSKTTISSARSRNLRACRTGRYEYEVLILIRWRVQDSWIDTLTKHIDFVYVLYFRTGLMCGMTLALQSEEPCMT
jgi:hypothetical protein